MTKQYVGVTGFTTRQEVNSVLFKSGALPRVVMVGVLASAKTLRGEVGTKAPRRYPRVEDIANIFTPDPGALNLIHFAPGSGPGLATQLAKLTTLGGPYLDGFQLNAIWPDVDELRKHAAAHGRQCDHRIVLQLGPTVLSTVSDAADLAIRVRQYAGVITDVLIDPSGGVGRAFDVEKAERYIDALSADAISALNIGIGVAGGLGPGALGSARLLMKKFPQLSIDAEGKLRDGNDDLSIEKASKYVREAFDIPMELL